MTISFDICICTTSFCFNKYATSCSFATNNLELKNGTYELKVPYSDDRDLIMDILKHGAGVLVVEPKSLRDRVTQMLHATLASYAQTL